jgi:hypothetical protein
VQDLQDTRKGLKITKKDRGWDAKPALSSTSRNLHRANGGAALVAMGAGAPGIEGLSSGTKRIEEARTNSMGGSPRAEDEAAVGIEGQLPAGSVRALGAAAVRRRSQGDSGGGGAQEGARAPRRLARPPPL